MKKINEIFDNLFKVIPGYYFGFLAFLISFLGAIIALLLSPDYVMWEKSISVLGHKAGGIYLRIGLIITGIISIPFIIYMGRAVRDETNKKYVREVAIIAGVFSSSCMALSGTFSGVNPFISWLHGNFALCSWLGGAVAFLSFSILIINNPKFSRYIAYVGFVIAGIFVFYLIPFFITNFCNYFADLCYDFGRAVYTINPTFEWAVYFSTVFWYLSGSIYIMYKKI
ncbi:MAG: hypothetical protein ACFE8B_02790 [Candidatus Hermodarchaeota archaeon]